MPAEYSSRRDRTGRVDETGNVGTVNVSFDVTGLSLPTNASEYGLLMDTDGEFSLRWNTETDEVITSDRHSF
ncbi:MAG: hypothetical protein ACI85Q_002691 [Salibacteraceae bacterium]